MAADKPLRIGLIVGETSGAILALGMIKQIMTQYPDCLIEGIGSEELNKLGMKSLFDMNELSVMGLFEVIKHLPRLLHIRKTVVAHFLANPPDVFIGVDAPDFNLRVEKSLKAAGIPTVHYVSPTVWAWREKRIHKIGKATNLVLGVFPFEKKIYDQYQLPIKFVGHTMADDVPMVIDKESSRAKLNLQVDSKSINTPLLALLPGSRAREIDSLLDIFLRTFENLRVKEPGLCAVIPAVNQARLEQITEIVDRKSYKQNIFVTTAAARDVMMASDMILLASGTAALEAMLCKRPMVVAYKMSGLTYMMMKRMYKPDYFALPNILANELLVPEFLQEDVNPDNLASHLLKVWRQDEASLHIQIDKFSVIHKSLKCHADKQAAQAVLTLIGKDIINE